MGNGQPSTPGFVIEQRAAREVPPLLAKYLGAEADVTSQRQVLVPSGQADLVLRYGDRVFAVEVKNSSRSAQVAHAALQARRYAEAIDAVPLVVVPFMGEAGSDACRELGVGFVDLSGNAHIEVPGIYVHVEGKPNLFVQRGRPSSPFAPRSSRIARALLIDPERLWTQHELASAVDVDPGFTSRIVGRLEDDGFIGREDGRLRVFEPGLLADAWAEDYAPSRDTAAMERIQTAESLDELFESIEVTEVGLKPPKRIRNPVKHLREPLALREWAAAGMTACQMLLGLPLDLPARVVVDRPMDLRTPAWLNWTVAPFDEAAVWLERAYDGGVFYERSRNEKLWRVSWAQAYVEAKNEPNPGPELAQALKEKVLQPVARERKGDNGQFELVAPVVVSVSQEVLARTPRINP